MGCRADWLLWAPILVSPTRRCCRDGPRVGVQNAISSPNLDAFFGTATKAKVGHLSTISLHSLLASADDRGTCSLWTSDQFSENPITAKTHVALPACCIPVRVILLACISPGVAPSNLLSLVCLALAPQQWPKVAVRTSVALSTASSVHAPPFLPSFASLGHTRLRQWHGVWYGNHLLSVILRQ